MGISRQISTRFGRALLVLALLSPPALVQAEIVVKATDVVEHDGLHWLRLTLWNCSTKPLAVSRSVAPWGEYTLMMGLYGADRLPGRVWAPESISQKVPSSRVTVPSGGHTSGEVALLFPPFGRHSQEKGPYVLFWSYNTGWLGEQPARQVSGTVNIGISGDEVASSGEPCGTAVR